VGPVLNKIRMHTLGISALFVSIIIFLILLPAIHNDFVNWGDQRVLIENYSIHTLRADLLSWAFTTFREGSWQPLTWLFHAACYHLWGLNPVKHHMTSLLLHSLNTFLIIILVARLAFIALQKSTTTRVRNCAIHIGILTGFIFGIHPLQMESVAWISAQKNLLAGLFFLLSVWCYIHFAERKIRGRRGYFWFSICLVFYAAAILTQAHAITLVFVFLLLDHYPLKRAHPPSPEGKTPGLFIEKIPFFLLSCTATVLHFIASAYGRSEGGVIIPPLETRILVAVKSLGFYLCNLLLPLNLTPYHPYPPQPEPVTLSMMIPVFAIVFVTVAGIVCWKKVPGVSALWLFYMITILPRLGLVTPDGTAMANHFVYIPALAFFIPLAVFVMVLLNHSAILVRSLTWVTASLYILFLSTVSLQQVHVWHDSPTFWTRVIDSHSWGIPVAHNYRAKAYAEIGDVHGGFIDCTKALMLNPEYADAYNIRGIMFARMGGINEAVEDYNTTLLLDPHHIQGFMHRGKAYDQLNRPKEAIQDYSKVIQMDPNNYHAYNARGVARAVLGRYQGALEDFNRAILLKSDFIGAYINRGHIYYRIGEIAKALADYNRAAEIDPQSVNPAILEACLLDDISQQKDTSPLSP